MVGALLQKGIGFALIPVFIRLLSKEDMGLLDISTTTMVLLCIIFAAGLPTIWQGDFFKHDSEKKKQVAQELISTYIGIIGPIAFVIFIVLQIFQQSIFGAQASIWTAGMITITAFLTFFQTIFRNTLELSQKPVVYVLNSLVIGLLSPALNIFMVKWLHAGYIGAMTGNLVGLILTFGHAWFEWKRRGAKFQFISNFKVWKKHLSVGLPFISIALAYWVVTSSDRWFIISSLDPAQLGLYGIATKFSSVFDPLLVAPILSVYTPFVYKRFAENIMHQKLGWLLLGTLLLFGAASIVVAFAARWVVTPDYYSILPLIPIQIMGYGFYLVTMMSNCALIYYKRSRETLYIILVIAAFNLTTNAILIPQYGIAGASLTFLVSNMLWTALSMWRNAAIVKQTRIN